MSDKKLSAGVSSHLLKPLTRTENQPCEGPGPEERDIYFPQIDPDLDAEMDWYIDIFHRLMPLGRQPLEPQIVFRVIIEGLMSLGLVAVDDTGERVRVSLTSGYERCGAVLVVLFSVLEVACQAHSEGLDDNQCLDKALDMKNWRPVEPLSSEIRPLVRKTKRGFPDRLVRKMSPDLFWFLALPRLLANGLVEDTLS